MQVTDLIAYSSPTGPTAAASCTPLPDHPPAGFSCERIKRRAVLGGLINEYERAA